MLLIAVNIDSVKLTPYHSVGRRKRMKSIWIPFYNPFHPHFYRRMKVLKESLREISSKYGVYNLLYHKFFVKHKIIPSHPFHILDFSERSEYKTSRILYSSLLTFLRQINFFYYPYYLYSFKNTTVSLKEEEIKRLKEEFHKFKGFFLEVVDKWKSIGEDPCDNKGFYKEKVIFKIKKKEEAEETQITKKVKKEEPLLMVDENSTSCKEEEKKSKKKYAIAPNIPLINYDGNYYSIEWNEKEANSWAYFYNSSFLPENFSFLSVINKILKTVGKCLRIEETKDVESLVKIGKKLDKHLYEEGILQEEAKLMKKAKEQYSIFYRTLAALLFVTHKFRLNLTYFTNNNPDNTIENINDNEEIKLLEELLYKIGKEIMNVIRTDKNSLITKSIKYFLQKGICCGCLCWKRPWVNQEILELYKELRLLARHGYFYHCN